MEALNILVFGGSAPPELDSTLEKISRSVPGSALHFRRLGGTTPAELESHLKAVRPDILFLHSLHGFQDKTFELLARTRRLYARLPILAAVQEMEASALLQLLEKGVTDFVVLPLRTLDFLPRMLRLGLRFREADPVLVSLKEKLGMRKLLGENARFIQEIGKIPKVAGSEATVLIQGETGTGKEICARTVHYLSPRAEKPFVPVNCGAIPSDLVENELFGHEREAFTGALASKPGLIREANGGTLFLDEVDSLPALAQVKLLRFLQEKEYRPLGASKAIKADVRVVAASNADLEIEVAKGRVRRDLYYRLNVIVVRLPPLRERKEDIPLLVKHFVAKYSQEFQKEGIEVSPQSLQQLALHDWPGNVRELEHVVQRAVLLCGDRNLRVSDFMPGSGECSKVKTGSLKVHKAKLIQDFERRYIQSILTEHGGNISHAALSAGKNRRAFWQLIQKHGISVEDFRSPNPRRETSFSQG